MAKKAAKLDLSIYQGEDRTFDAVHFVSGLPDAARVDIRGWSILVTVKVKADDEASVLEVDDVAVDDDDQGGYRFTITAADSAELDAKVHAIDVWRVDADAKTMMGKGTLTVLQPVRTPA